METSVVLQRECEFFCQFVHEYQMRRSIQRTSEVQLHFIEPWVVYNVYQAHI